MLLDAPATKLISRENEDGSTEVLGVAYNSKGKSYNLKAKKGVHIASGGFDHDAQMKKNFLSIPSYGVGVKSNTGDGIKMAMKLGATGPGKSQFLFAPLFMSIRAFSDQKMFHESSSNWGDTNWN